MATVGLTAISMTMADSMSVEEPDRSVELGVLRGHGTAVRLAVAAGGDEHCGADVLDQLRDLVNGIGFGFGLHGNILSTAG